MKKRKLAIVALVLAFVMAMPMTAMARPIDDVNRITINGQVFLPLRAAAYAYGASVEWDGENRLVIITSAAGDTWSVDVEGLGGFIEDGTSWMPYEYIIGVFDTAAVEEAGRPQIHGMLTRIEYGGNVAYIFGSMHAGQPDWFPLHPMVEDAMARADVFGFEVDMGELMNLTPEQLEELEALQTLPDGLTLEDVLPQDVFEQFIAAFESFAVIGLEYEMIANLTPLALVYALEVLAVALDGADIDPGTQMVDGYIYAFAQERGRPIIGFEDIMDQARLLYDVPLDLQIYAMLDFPDFETLMARVGGDDGMNEAYARQDMDVIRAILYDGGWAYDGNPLEARNHYIMWNYRCNIYANGIAELLRETEEPTTFFFTFGLSHIMGGNAGIVLYLLDDMGFDVVPLWQ